MELTPKEKAKDLMIKMLGFTPDFNDIHLEVEIHRDIYEAKLNSLICVNETIKAIPVDINPITYMKNTIYWYKVKKELETF